MTVYRFSMTISLLKFCIYDILRKILENMEFLDVLKKAQICSNSGTKLVKFHGGSQNSMTFCSYFMFLEFSTFIFQDIQVLQSLCEPCIETPPPHPPIIQSPKNPHLLEPVVPDDLKLVLVNQIVLGQRKTIMV